MTARSRAALSAFWRGSWFEMMSAGAVHVAARLLRLRAGTDVAWPSSAP